MLFVAGNTAMFWLAVMIVLLIIEGVVPGLVSVWFAMGALAAMISALFEAPFWLQTVWFLIVSIASLCLTRPLVKKYVNSKVQPTNADALIGKECIVTESIDNIAGEGAVKISGQVWTARSTDDSVKIAQGKIVTVKEIRGVKLIVE
mgnify:FL=1